MPSRQDLPNGYTTQLLSTHRNSNTWPHAVRYSIVDRAAHASTDHDAICCKEFQAPLHKLRSYTDPLFPVSFSSDEYQKLKEGQAKPTWHAARSEKQALQPNGEKHIGRHADGLKHEHVQEAKKMQDSKVTTLSQDSKIVKLQHWALARRMCRRVNNAALKTTSDVHVKFVPRSRFEAALGGKVAIQELFKTIDRSISADRQRSLHKILIVLCLMDCPSKIRLFIDSGIYDTNLPLIECPCPTGVRDVKVLRSKGNMHGSYMSFKTAADTETFLKKQWSVLAWTFPEFDRTVSHEDFEDEVILPYLSHKHIARKGGFGDVYKVEIHPDHCSSKGRSRIYAIKTLKSRVPEDFNHERKVLEKLRQTNHSHQHLIALLATYKYRHKYHLIFPWAESDLFGYWERKPVRSKIMEQWIAGQFQGLAEALYKIHRYPTTSTSSLWQVPVDANRMRVQRNIPTIDEAATFRSKILYGRHGDLKPENILWYPDSAASDPTAKFGTLKITDFGGAHFNDKDEWSLSSPVPRLTTYRSPEVDIDGTCSTLCDIWAMGCIFLEFSTWYHGGPKCVEKFTKQRLARDITLRGQWSDTFFTLSKYDGKGKAKVKDAVNREIARLQLQCNSYFKELLELVRDNMLVIKPNHVASEHGTPPTVDMERLHPHPSRVLDTSKSRRYSQGSSLQASATSTQESRALRTPISATPEALHRSGSGTIQQALGDMLVRMKGRMDTSTTSTAEEMSSYPVVSQRYSLPERLILPLLQRAT